MDSIKIINTDSNNILDYGVCGYKNLKRPGYPEKIKWLEQRYREGMKIKILHSEKDGTQGMIEYIPGEYCWRPVEAKGYMFIHCLFVGFKKAYKGKGYATLLLDECEKDAKNANMYGIAVVSRKGAFMAGRDIFIKNGFQAIDHAPSDFELLVKHYNDQAPWPRFKGNWEKRCQQYGKGLIIIRADQCPYTVKNVNEIFEVAENIYHIKPIIIEFQNHREAQESPCPFGTFCIIYNGKVISEHPISKTRFSNIMNTIID